MGRLTLIILGIIITIISHFIISLWNKSKNRNIFAKFFEAQLDGIELFFPKLDISFNYAALRGRMNWRILVYILYSCLSYINFFLLTSALCTVMVLKLINDFADIKKTKSQLAASPFSDQTEYRKYFIFQPVFLALYQFVLTLLLYINLIFF